MSLWNWDLFRVTAAMVLLAGFSLAVLAALPFNLVANRHGRFFGLEASKPPPQTPSSGRTWRLPVPATSAA